MSDEVPKRIVGVDHAARFWIRTMRSNARMYMFIICLTVLIWILIARVLYLAVHPAYFIVPPAAAAVDEQE
jgi:hypothetical protein